MLSESEIQIPNILTSEFKEVHYDEFEENGQKQMLIHFEKTAYLDYRTLVVDDIQKDILNKFDSICYTKTPTKSPKSYKNDSKNQNEGFDTEEKVEDETSKSQFEGFKMNYLFPKDKSYNSRTDENLFKNLSIIENYDLTIDSQDFTQKINGSNENFQIDKSSYRSKNSPKVVKLDLSGISEHNSKSEISNSNLTFSQTYLNKSKNDAHKTHSYFSKQNISKKIDQLFRNHQSHKCYKFIQENQQILDFIEANWEFPEKPKQQLHFLTFILTEFTTHVLKKAAKHQKKDLLATNALNQISNKINIYSYPENIVHGHIKKQNEKIEDLDMQVESQIRANSPIINKVQAMNTIKKVKTITVDESTNLKLQNKCGDFDSENQYSFVGYSTRDPYEKSNSKIISPTQKIDLDNTHPEQNIKNKEFETVVDKIFNREKSMSEKDYIFEKDIGIKVMHSSQSPKPPHKFEPEHLIPTKVESMVFNLCSLDKKLSASKEIFENKSSLNFDSLKNKADQQESSNEVKTESRAENYPKSNSSKKICSVYDINLRNTGNIIRTEEKVLDTTKKSNKKIFFSNKSKIGEIKLYPIEENQNEHEENLNCVRQLSKEYTNEIAMVKEILAPANEFKTQSPKKKDSGDKHCSFVKISARGNQGDMRELKYESENVTTPRLEIELVDELYVSQYCLGSSLRKMRQQKTGCKQSEGSDEKQSENQVTNVKSGVKSISSRKSKHLPESHDSPSKYTSTEII